MVSTTLQSHLVSTTTAGSHGVNNYRSLRWCQPLPQLQVLRLDQALPQAHMVSTITAGSDGVNSRSLKWCLPLPQSQMLSWFLLLLQLQMASSSTNDLFLRLFLHPTRSNVHPRPTVFPLLSLKIPRFLAILVKVRGLHLLSLFSSLMLLTRALGAF